MVFLVALMQAAQRKGIGCQTQTVLRGPDGAGRVDVELPWVALSTQKRLGWIKNELQAVEKVFRTEGPEVYEARATRLYARIRQTWERGVEDLLLVVWLSGSDQASRRNGCTSFATFDRPTWTQSPPV